MISYMKIRSPNANALSAAAEYAVVSDRIEGEIGRELGLEPMTDRFGGRVFEYTNAKCYSIPEMQTILTRGGFTFAPLSGTAARASMPDPQRLLACKQAYDLPIKFVAETIREGSNGPIPGKVYESVVRSGHHPVSVANIDYYCHDISGNDHFPAVIVGGRPLINWIIANTPPTDDLADIYDMATSDVTNLLFQLFTNRGTLASDIRETINLFKSQNDPTKLVTDGPMSEADQAKDRELRRILYDGLKKVGIDHPPILAETDSLRRLGWSMLSKKTS